MLDDKLFRHYSHLVELGVQQDIAISLKDISEKLFTSLRHARTLLKSMQESGWLTWTPKAGRSQRSLLRLHYELQQLKADIAASLIVSGKYEKALMLVDGDHSVFGQLLQKTSGAIRREGLLHIQLTYRRLFSSLLPHKPQRNSERFLLRQIYSCLVHCDKDGLLTPLLAHHWEHDDQKTCWKFYLRPQLFFHNDQEINADAVVQLFNQLKVLPEYQKELNHLHSVSAVHPLCIEFCLTQPDWGFAGLLADIRYSIQPAGQVIQSLSSIVGSGAFYLQEQSKERVRLQAFNKFHASRALTDSVTIWQLPQKKADSFAKTLLQTGIAEQTKTSCSHYVSVNETQNTIPEGRRYTRIEDGCLLLLFNQQSDDTELTSLQRRYLCSLLTPGKLLKQLNTDENQLGAVTAYNLLPSWHKTYRKNVEKQTLPAELSIAVFDHFALLDCAKAISSVLQENGVQCQVNVYSFAELQQKASKKQLSEALILSSMNLDDNRPTSIFRWLLSNPVLEQVLLAEESDWLMQVLTGIRAAAPLTEYLFELEAVATSMIYENWIFPLFHHRQSLQFEEVLKGISITDWGWPAMQHVWSED